MTILGRSEHWKHGPPIQNMTQKVVIFETNSLDDEGEANHNWPPENVHHFIEWLKRISWYEVPEQHRKSVTIEFSSEMYYDNEPCTQLCISYWRSETEEEFAVRYKRYEAELNEQADQTKSTYYPHWDYKGKLHNHNPDMKDKKCDNSDWKG